MLSQRLRVSLWTSTNTLVASTTTDTEGPANVGSDDTLDSDASDQGMTAAFTLSESQTLTDIDAGLIYVGIDDSDPPTGTASIAGTVWKDANGDGIQDSGESLLAGFTVDLFDALSNWVGTTLTDSQGNYQFTSLAAGSYRVVFTIPGVPAFSPKDQGSDDTVDSDVNSLGISDLITLSSGQSLTNLDASVLGWFDIDGDGVQDVGEPLWV
jgi:hypothetical protein